MKRPKSPKNIVACTLAPGWGLRFHRALLWEIREEEGAHCYYISLHSFDLAGPEEDAEAYLAEWAEQNGIPMKREIWQGTAVDPLTLLGLEGRDE